MWTVLTCFALAIVSALLPWVNAEVLLLAVAAPMTSAIDLAVIVVAVTAGQVSGKGALYWIARRVPHSPTGHFGRAVDRWRVACAARPSSAQTMMLVSAIFGVPPFYATTVAAGALKINFGRFLSAAIVGRLLHFSGIALAPVLLHACFR
jgi:membrane protein YqaA with SNARE-associated domain